MYCVIQEIRTRKPDKNGYPKELISGFTNSSLLGCYYHHYYGEERFKRPIRKAYRISIHESYREDGKVKKRQYVICTVGYYELAAGWFTLYDWGDQRIKKVSAALGCSMDILYELIEKKLGPLQARLEAEFMQTEECMTHEEHERITTIYAAQKAQFNEKYGTSRNEYDQCYDVFGTLQNPQRLKEIEAEYKARRQYERRSQQESRSYYENFYSNYSSKAGSSGGTSSIQSEDNKAMFKKFYRTLSKAYHPDSNPGVDTSEEMKLLNQIKSEWGV